MISHFNFSVCIPESYINLKAYYLLSFKSRGRSSGILPAAFNSLNQ